MREEDIPGDTEADDTRAKRMKALELLRSERRWNQRPCTNIDP